jgi:hypothetical protein
LTLGAEGVVDLRRQSLDALRGRVDAAFTLKRGGILVSSVAQPDVDLMHRNGIRGEYFIVQVTTSHLDRIARLRGKTDF